MRRLAAVCVILVGLIGTGLIISKSLDLLGYEGQVVSYVGRWEDLDAIEVKQDTTLGQTFLAPQDGLYRIDVMLLDYERRNTQPVTFHLRESPEANTDLFTQTFMASEVHGPTWLTFTFAPLPESGGKTYFFYLESPTSSQGDAITIGGVTNDLYPRGNAYLSWQAVANADAAFRTYYAGVTTEQKIQRLFTELAKYRPAIWGNIGFYWGVLGAYLVVIACFFLVIFRSAIKQ